MRGRAGGSVQRGATVLNRRAQSSVLPRFPCTTAVRCSGVVIPCSITSLRSCRTCSSGIDSTGCARLRNTCGGPAKKVHCLGGMQTRTMPLDAGHGLSGCAGTSAREARYAPKCWDHWMFGCSGPVLFELSILLLLFIVISGIQVTLDTSDAATYQILRYIRELSFPTTMHGPIRIDAAISDFTLYQMKLAHSWIEYIRSHGCFTLSLARAAAAQWTRNWAHHRSTIAVAVPFGGASDWEVRGSCQPPALRR
jgi:hypothetical protein